ncbi:hypothetical protein OG215_41080 (plasmid) [Streptomyces globisporus]|uniref:hypothetical protein n=1 Tax=Streptomyces globisporus TaxID=1908 RepID=UPI002F909590|nr:hypothetical protein OG215_41080 [Streptomyces globisporus]
MSPAEGGRGQRNTAPVGHGFARLKSWRVLTRLRTGPACATRLLRALLVLAGLEINH